LDKSVWDLPKKIDFPGVSRVKILVIYKNNTVCNPMSEENPRKPYQLGRHPGQQGSRPQLSNQG